jgi:hypothetical protein
LTALMRAGWMEAMSAGHWVEWRARKLEQLTVE